MTSPKAAVRPSGANSEMLHMARSDNEKAALSGRLFCMVCRVF